MLSVACGPGEELLMATEAGVGRLLTDDELSA
jgi:hypothetical protein